MLYARDAIVVLAQGIGFCGDSGRWLGAFMSKG